MKADPKFVVGDFWKMEYCAETYIGRIICTDMPGRYPIVVMDDTGGLWTFIHHGEDVDGYRLTHQIVPLRYSWDNVYPDGRIFGGYPSLEKANAAASPARCGIAKYAFLGNALVPSECVIEDLS